MLTAALRCLAPESKPVIEPQIIVKPLGMNSIYILIGIVFIVTVAFGIGPVLSLVRKVINHS